MLITSEIIAKKYAVALLNASKEELSEQMMHQIEQFDAFLKKHQSILALLAPPTLSRATKSKIIHKIALHFRLGDLFGRMLLLLLETKRIYLLEVIIKHIIRQYQKRRLIGVFDISTSHPLQEQEKQRIIDFITKVAPHKNIIATFAIAPKLINGIRIQSDTLLWERSINKFLQRVEKTMFQRVGL